MGESKLLLALFCNKILTKSEQGVVVVVISWRSGCVTMTVTLQLYRGGECVYQFLHKTSNISSLLKCSARVGRSAGDIIAGQIHLSEFIPN